MNTKLLFASIASLATTAGLASTASAGVEVGAQLQLLPMGELSTEVGNQTFETDADPTFGIAANVGYAITPNISVGFAPRLILNIKGEDSDEDSDAATQLDLAARITGKLPVAPKLDLFAHVSPGYSLLFVDNLPDEASQPGGFGIAVGGGVGYKVTPTLSITGELGYSAAFLSSTTETPIGDVDANLDTSFFHLGVGLQAAL